jgi:hypothetical protein
MSSVLSLAFVNKACDRIMVWVEARVRVRVRVRLGIGLKLG